MLRNILIALILGLAISGMAVAADTDDGPIDETGEALASVGNKAAEVGHKALQGAGEVAETVSDAVVYAGKVTVDAVGDAAHTAHDAVSDTLGLEEDTTQTPAQYKPGETTQTPHAR